MERLKKYLGRPIKLANVKDTDQLATFSFECRYLPDPPEEFDEFEFVTKVGTVEQLGLMVTVQSMKVVKLFFGSVDPENSDLVSGLTEAQLSSVFNEAGHNILELLDYITQEPPTS